MAMGYSGYTDLMAAKYLPLMMGGSTRHWLNSLTPGSIDSWHDMKDAFINHFADAYSHTTTIEDLDRCVQGSRESTHALVKRWQELWMRGFGIEQQTGVYCFMKAVRYPPLVAKLQRDRKLIKMVNEVIDIAKRYAEEDPNRDSSDELTGRHHRRSTRYDDSSDSRESSRHNGHSSTGKRRSDYVSDLAANVGYAPRDTKSGRFIDCQADRSERRRFDAKSLLDVPCILHSREGRPANHTTAQCYSLREIEKAKRANGGSKNHDGANKDANNAFDEDHGSLHTFIGIDDKRDKKVLARAVAVNSVAASAIRYLNWSEQPITQSRTDHAAHIEYPGRVALIVRPKVGDHWLPKTLMTVAAPSTSYTSTPFGV